VRPHGVPRPVRRPRGDADLRGDRAADHRAALHRGHPEGCPHARDDQPPRRRAPQSRDGHDEPRRDLPSGGLGSSRLYRVTHGTAIHQAAPETLSPELARQYTAVPVDLEGHRIVVAFAEPASDEALAAIGNATSFEVIPAVADRAELNRAIDMIYGPASANPL